MTKYVPNCTVFSGPDQFATYNTVKMSKLVAENVPILFTAAPLLDTQ